MDDGPDERHTGYSDGFSGFSLWPGLALADADVWGVNQ